MFIACPFICSTDMTYSKNEGNVKKMDPWRTQLWFDWLIDWMDWLDWMYWLIDWIVLNTVSAIFQGGLWFDEVWNRTLILGF